LVFDHLMDQTILAQHAPDPVFVSRARMSGRRFLINQDGQPSMAPRRGHVVHGLVFELEDVGLTCLSLQLGVPSTYERYGAFARDVHGTLMAVEFHATRDQRPGKGSPDHIASIMAYWSAMEFPRGLSGGDRWMGHGP
jgi:hypothetical protein